MKVLATIILSALSFGALADNSRGFYVGAGMAEVMYDDDEPDVSNSRAFELFGGYKYNSALGLEIRAGRGAKSGKGEIFYTDSEDNLEVGQVERELDSYYSVYYKPELINDEAKLYLLLGYMKADSTETMIGGSGAVMGEEEFSESGASYGIGVGFIVTEKINFNVEYRTIPSEGDNEPSIVSANFDYRF